MEDKMKIKIRREFDRDFKINVVLLFSEPGRTVVNVTKNLGIFKELIV